MPQSAPALVLTAPPGPSDGGCCGRATGLKGAGLADPGQGQGARESGDGAQTAGWPMLAQASEAIPPIRPGAGVAYEQKFDGHRALLFTPPVPGGQVLIQTRRGSMVQDGFPDLVTAAVEQIPPGLVLDGELLVWDPEAGALSFEVLQRRAAVRARGAPALAARWPAYFVAFDVLQLEGQELLNRPYKERRALLERLFTDRALTAPWTLCPMTTDLAEDREWLQTWTDVSGVEGIVVKPLSSRYLPAHTRGVDHDQKTGHHRSGHRRHHRNPEPPAAPDSRLPRSDGPAARSRPHRTPAPRGLPTGRRVSGRRRPRTPVDRRPVRRLLGHARGPGRGPGPPRAGGGDQRRPRDRPRRRLPSPAALPTAAPGRDRGRHLAVRDGIGCRLTGQGAVAGSRRARTPHALQFPVTGRVQRCALLGCRGWGRRRGRGRVAGGNVSEGGGLVEWDCWTVEFGDAHSGAVGVLVGGGEPGPVYFDVGSGPEVPSTSHWSAYDGRRLRPRAEALRASCVCGWRGAAEYPLDWDAIGDEPLYEADVDLTGPLADWNAHLSLVRDKAAPLREPLAVLLVEIAGQLTATTADAPLSALRAAGVLERIAARITREAAGALSDAGMSAEAVAAGLGTTRSKALMLLLTAQDG